MTASLHDSREVLRLIKMINVAIRRAKVQPANISFGRIPGFKALDESICKEDLGGLRIFTFVDAVFRPSAVAAESKHA